MYLIINKNENSKQAYSVINKNEENIILFFRQYDDAERYRILLEENNTLPSLHIAEYNEDDLIKIATVMGRKYSIIEPYDLVVPPNTFAK